MEYPVTTEIPVSDPRYNEILSAFYAECTARLLALAEAGADLLDMTEGWEKRLSRLLATRPRRTGSDAPLPAPLQIHRPAIAPEDRPLLDEMLHHALGQRAAPAETVAQVKTASEIWCRWDKTGVTDKDGKPFPIQPFETAGGTVFIRRGHSEKLHRAVAFLSGYASHGGTAPVTSDFADARFFGTGRHNTPDRPVFSNARRAGARNMVLWPLTGYHRPFAESYVSTTPFDQTGFWEKEDLCVWRGALTGRSKEALNPAGYAPTGTRPLLIALDEAAPGSPEAEDLIAQMRTITRFHVTERVQGHPSYDFALSIPGGHGQAQRHAPIARLLKPRVPRDWTRRFRYVCSFSGYDTGSNFLGVVNSFSLCFKEEHGWETFYSGSYKPWEHYVPLALGATDLDERLDWARANPARCAEMVRAAQALSARIAHLPFRSALLSAIAEEAGA
jgi:hypothetical protein